MKISKSFIATAVIAVLPLVAFGGDKDKTTAPTGTAASAQFDTLDANRDGRLRAKKRPPMRRSCSRPPTRMATDTSTTASTAHRDMSNDSSKPEKTPQ